ncbi:hypothetical protein DSM104299_02536 [Baekduia alba]|uniref:hypothetical protein n=1 Tax=Baekduia alba TaxID=2997333 RepID=UPI0023420993|nr:hypothetical protein [Baekduia alba]WCB93817.1 hypothetical protein DSM104299_02536 [Baekduia alba]
MSDDAASLLADLTEERTAWLDLGRRQALWTAWTTTALGGLFALVHAFGLDAADVAAFDGETQRLAWLPTPLLISILSACVVVTATLRVLAWRASVRLRWVRGAMAQLGRMLEDERRLAGVLDAVAAEARLDTDWTREHLAAGVARWCGLPPDGAAVLPRGLVARSLTGRLRGRSRDEPATLRDLARVAGPADFARLTIAGGVRHGLLAEQRSTREERVELRYRRTR